MSVITTKKKITCSYKMTNDINQEYWTDITKIRVRLFAMGKKKFLELEIFCFYAEYHEMCRKILQRMYLVLD